MMGLHDSSAEEPAGVLPLPPSIQMGQPPVNVDDLRRSGKIAIWPYILRELPLSPVEALRLELLSREKGRGTPSSQPVVDAKHTRKGVEYFPSRLTEGGDNSIGSLGRKGTHDTDFHLGALKEKLWDVELRERDILSTRGENASVMRTAEGFAMHQGPATGVCSSPDGMVTKGRRPQLFCGRKRPSSCGPCRRPPMAHFLGGGCSVLRNGMGNCVECPAGCGEGVRLNDLKHHQASNCALRYVSCLMPGCTTFVQARLLHQHLRRDCSKRRQHRVLADKGMTLNTVVACDACNEGVPRKHLRGHVANDCQMRMVQCPDCNAMVQARSLSEHRRLDCKTAKRKAALSAQMGSRAVDKECPACHERFAPSILHRHASEECPSRIVACPNKALGCTEELSAAEMVTHLRKQQCIVQVERAERASKHVFRRQRVKCSGCGYSVVRQHLIRHHREKCPDRRVPCKHRELGCPAMLRLSAMDDHLKADRLLEPRACLAFDGGRAYIALGEADQKPPWTAEMWIWRPGLVESTREKARAALQALWEFQRVRAKLAVTERRLALLEPLLLQLAARAAKEHSKEAEQARNKLTDEMIAAATVRDDAKVDLAVSVVLLANSLASAVRGVKELTAQDRLNGFDRLALGSTPWYAAAPGVSGQGTGSDAEGCGTKKAPALKRIPPPCQPSAHIQIKTIPHQQEVMGGEISSLAALDDDQPRPKASGVGATIPVVLEPNGKTAKDSGASTDGKAEDLGVMLSRIASEQQELETAEEEASRKREAGFWAEWVALAGPSLAKKIVALEGETLPRLRNEAVAVTGLSSGVLLRNSDESKTEEADGTIQDKEGGSVAGTSTASAKTREKSKKAAKKAKRKQKHEKIFGKNIEARIAEEVGRRGGVETLFGSEKALFQLDMGSKGRIGIKLAGKNNQVFNYSCPRERWVHLAFVSDKAGVVILENGKTVSRLRDIVVALPMRDIGGRETACQCLLQEVRYWKVKKPKEDLVKWMHEILPGTAVAEGLLGYWTFEEGQGEHIHDVTDQRFRARKVGRGLKWAFSENMHIVEVGATPTPSWREQNVCKVELRRGRLAMRGRLHRQLVSCPAGCGEYFSQRDGKAHAAYRCLLRIVGCSLASCTKSMPAKDVPRHLEEDCPAHHAWLRMAEAGQELQESCACPDCGELIKRAHLKLHATYLCHWIKEQCRNEGCGAYIPRLRREEHEKRFCGAAGAIRRRRRLARARALSKYRRDWAQDGE